LNADGFVPFERRIFSLWNFIFTILNLPRGVRFKNEFSLLCSVNQPDKSGFNGILHVLVSELQNLERGFYVETEHSGKVKCKVRLVMVCCDIPATRKVLGFVGSNATAACNFCKYSFPRIRYEHEKDSQDSKKRAALLLFRIFQKFPPWIVETKLKLIFLRLVQSIELVEPKLQESVYRKRLVSKIRHF
jgi:hypothetical protein